ncbi:MAG: hypothetical protein J1E63_01800 [Muribaculaceae bacterium]|nr:hypothetical protein [Muribaculaceae bacterium]
MLYSLILNTIVVPSVDSLLGLPLSLPLVIALAAALVAAFYIMLSIVPKATRVDRKNRRDTASVESGEVGRIDPAAFPTLSVIVYVDSNPEDLPTMLPMILEQDYPAPMEVIVVNDGERSELEGILGDLELRYRNLYMTFTPPNSRNLSRKKLSLTIGVKAARYDTLVITNSSVRPTSSRWLRAMAAPVAAGAEIVLGHSILSPATEEVDGRLSRAASFDIGLTAIRYYSKAMVGIPYRADGNNLVYRKAVFDLNRGFSTHHNFRYGDDDIFINQVARKGHRVAVQLAGDAVVRQLVYDLPYAHGFDKMRYMFTQRHVKTWSRFTAALTSLAWWTWLAASIAALVIGYPSLPVLGIVTVISLLACIPVMVAYRRGSSALYLRRLTFTVPFLMLWYPVYNLYYRIAARKVRSKNYTWTNGCYTASK